jgi:hypothetical protein
VALLDPSRLARSASCTAASSDSRTLNFLIIATPHRGSLAHRLRYGFSGTSAVVAWRTNRKVCARSRLGQRWPHKILWRPDVVQDFTRDTLLLGAISAICSCARDHAFATDRCCRPDRAGDSLADGVTIWSSAVCRACHLQSDQEIHQSHLEVTSHRRDHGPRYKSAVASAPERPFTRQCADHLYNNHFCNNATLHYSAFWMQT